VWTSRRPAGVHDDHLAAEFGERRVQDSGISVQVVLGAAMDAAMTGLRQVAEVGFAGRAAGGGRARGRGCAPDDGSIFCRFTSGHGLENE
jgi:hypothetical protein